MAALKFFIDFDEKKNSFSNTKHFRIETKQEFDEWFDEYTKETTEDSKTNFMYRGADDARYKLYTSAQRLWIQNDMKEWVSEGFSGFVNSLVREAKTHPLIKKVFEVNGYKSPEEEIPILSIIQHYAGPTPLMDWTYNINVALFFATERLTAGNGNGDIDDYFSIYRIDKTQYVSELMSIRDYFSSGAPSLEHIMKEFGDDPNNPHKNIIFYISDFDKGNTYNSTPADRFGLIQSKALTSVYNQNIIPQEGLFIFNPFCEKTIDEVFNTHGQSGNLDLTPFSCFNIKKDLSDYIRRRIKQRDDIDYSFIYPSLKSNIEFIKGNLLNSYVKA